MITGTATDAERVELFLDGRDARGTFVGAVNLQQPSAFQVTITLPLLANGKHELFAHAHSSVSGAETVMSVPILVGARPK